LKTYLDKDLVEATKEKGIIWIHCGYISRSISMKLSDFIKIENPKIIECSKTRIELNKNEIKEY
jgi:hypothetical protein